MEQEILKLMKTLDLTREEAIELYNEDKEVDKMKLSEVDSDLTDEQKEAVKKMKNAGGKKKPFVPKLDKRPRKENPTKRGIIQDIFKALQENGYENLNILKPEKEITFDMGGDNYSISLICHRKPK